MRHLLALLLLAGCSPERAATKTPAPATQPPQPTEAESSEEASICRPVAFPDTQAGRRLEHFVAAIVATDASLREQFIDHEMSADFLAAIPRARHIEVFQSLHNDGRPILLCRVESTEDDEVVAILGGSDDKGEVEYGRFTLLVGGKDKKVSSLSIEPAAKEDLTRKIEPLDDDAVRRVVEGVADGLADYVYADKAEKMASRIRKAQQAGDYSGITNPRKLARRLTDDLLAVTGDKHLHVIYSGSVLPPPPKPDRKMSPEEIERFKKHAAADNFGMPVAEIREGNVGYLVILGFLPPEVATDAVEATLPKLADADALIIDLRQNGGGHPKTVALVTSYLFGKKPVHLNDIYCRAEDRTESFYTSPDVPGRHFGPRKPIFVLTSQRTFSAGEEFAYNLKARKRATIIGEVTGGGAHPTTFVRVSDHWGIALPHARAINPITKTNWEGTGVKPDIELPADQALDKALELAAKKGK